MCALKKVLVISGMTGIGKSSAAFELAKKLNGEIICADSIQIYKQLRIIANTVGMESQDQVKYHLLRKYEATSPINAIKYAQDAREVIKDIWRRDKLPIIEGGSSFYIDSIFKNNLQVMNEEKYNNAKLVARRIIELDGKNFTKSYERLLELHPETKRMTLNNDFYRLSNAFTEALYLKSVGKTLDEFDNECLSDAENIFFSQGIDKRAFYLYGDKLGINKLLDIRCENMLLTQGFFEEIMDNLNTQSNYTSKEHNPVRKAIGFMETVKIMQEICQMNDVDFYDKVILNNKFYEKYITKLLKNFFEEFKVKTRKLAKKQHKWYKTQHDFLWLKSEGNVDDLTKTIKDVAYFNNCSRDIYEEKLKDPHQLELRQDAVSKDMRTYTSKSRIFNDRNILENFTKVLFQTAVKNKEAILNFH